MAASLSELSTYLGEKLPGRFGDAVLAYGELTVNVEPQNLIEVMTFLRDDARCQFISIIDVCGADYPSRAKRFDVVYHLLSPKQNVRIRVKVQADEETMV
ncbi:MAG: NADH-quinone oxidoreductase subunit C, partial [Mesorhizobium sp.]